MAAISRSMRGNAIERQRRKIMGTACNHPEMMVATEKRNPVNITFYLSKVISPMFLDSVCTPRFPRIRKIHTRLQIKQKQQETRTPENSSLAIPFIVHNFILERNSQLTRPASRWSCDSLGTRCDTKGKNNNATALIYRCPMAPHPYSTPQHLVTSGKRATARHHPCHPTSG